jgi:hypothetical protein
MFDSTVQSVGLVDPPPLESLARWHMGLDQYYVEMAVMLVVFEQDH